MRTVKLTIEYDGTDFNGWQIQEKGKCTVQGQIEKALRKIFKKQIRVYGSGRTDSGVHAKGQVAHFKCNPRLKEDQILKALNANLPDSITILAVEFVAASFHAQFKAKRKIYRYTILNRVAKPAMNRRFCLHYPYKMNCPRMRQAALSLIGRKDFRSFVASDPKKRDQGKHSTTVRRVHRLDIKRKGDYIYIDIEANGFLYKMVRNIVGTLLDVGTGRLEARAVPEILKGRDRTLAAATAPALGLCLLTVSY